MERKIKRVLENNSIMNGNKGLLIRELEFDNVIKEIMEISLWKKFSEEVPDDGSIIITKTGSFFNGISEQMISFLRETNPELQWMYLPK